LEGAQIKGPIFVSIGDKEKLNAFLDKNPNIPRNSMFVDGYNFEAYNKVGLKRITDQDTDVMKEVQMKIPKLSFQQWSDYVFSLGKVSPIPKDIPFGKIPEGVLRLGGTFVVNGDDIVYQWSDKIPGDHPDILEVISIASDVSQQEKQSLPPL
jgi:hypothetical protein